MRNTLNAKWYPNNRLKWKCCNIWQAIFFCTNIGNICPFVLNFMKTYFWQRTGQSFFSTEKRRKFCSRYAKFFGWFWSPFSPIQNMTQFMIRIFSHFCNGQLAVDAFQTLKCLSNYFLLTIYHLTLNKIEIKSTFHVLQVLTQKNLSK